MKAAKAKKKLPAKKKRAATRKGNKQVNALLTALGANLKGKKKFKTIHCTLAKGLTRKEAIKAARKKHKGDHRGFTYNAKTGKATLT